MMYRAIKYLYPVSLLRIFQTFNILLHFSESGKVIEYHSATSLQTSGLVPSKYETC